MRLAMAVTVGVLVCAASASAQSTPFRTQGYVEGFAQSAFGNVTSQSFGVEAGVRIVPDLQIFAEGGRTRDIATADIGTAAQKIAGSLAQLQSGVSYSVKQPVSYIDAGLRWLAPVSNPNIQPYVLAGVGVAQVKQDVHFTVNGTDVTSNLQQYSIVLGTDLSGSFNKPLMVLGGGVEVPLWHRLVADLQFRYGRIFADPGINMSRAGLGLGVRF